MTSLLSAPSDLDGAQLPRIYSYPEYASTSGYEAIELAALAGLELDEWQQFVLINSLGEAPIWKCPWCTARSLDETYWECPEHPNTEPIHPWSAFEVGICVPRQNGKGGIIEARELAGLFLLGERLIIHTAHEALTSDNAFDRLWELIENTPELLRRVKGGKPSRAHGNQAITLTNGQKIRFRTRTSGGARGLSGDLLILDEAMDISAAKVSAVIPLLSTRPNPQILYAGSAVDKQIHADGVVFARVRERGIEGGSRLAYFEWSARGEIENVDRAFTADPQNWAQANPALGIRISSEYIEDERAAFGAPRGFAVERLGVGDWPRTDDSVDRVIAPALWSDLEDDDSTSKDPICIAYDVNPDRRGSVALCGERPDGGIHVELLRSENGTAWIVDFLAGLRRQHKVWAFLCDPRGPAGSLVPEVEEVVGKRSDGESNLMQVNSYEHAQACGQFLDTVQEGGLSHPGSIALDDAVAGSSTRMLGDSWLWDRKNSSVDIAPLVAVTLAFWGNYKRPKRAARVINLNDLD